MVGLIDKLVVLNEKDPNWSYSIQILPLGSFVLHGISASGMYYWDDDASKREVNCHDEMELIAEMDLILENL